ncbi:MAG: hypothetical protein KDE34_00015 [Anaerolineales bacterium]|nr:hypothetical protein [Anaerolineales bacterium]
MDRRRSPEWVKQFEVIVLSGIITISLVVTLLDFLGVLDQIQWLKDRVPILILLATVGIAGYLLLERRNQLESNEVTQQMLVQLGVTAETATSTIIKSLGGVEIRHFEMGSDLLKYVNQRLRHVRRQVDDLSWSAEVGLGVAIERTRQANTEYVNHVKTVSQNCLYRDVFIFNMPRRVEKLRQILAESPPGYSCAYYAPTDIPLLQFMVIDQEEVILLSDEYPQKLVIRHKGLARLFSEYYEQIWAKATKIKEGDVIHQDVVKKLEQDYNQQLHR